MEFRYLTDSEYERAFFEFGNFRSSIADRVSGLVSSRKNTILDFLAGHGLLSAEMAIRFPESKICAIGLRNDVKSWERVRKSNRFPERIWRNFQYLTADVRQIPLRSSSCEIIVSFLGLEDLHMTSGKKGTNRAISEMGRVAKDNALVQISMVEYGDTPEEKIANEVWNVIGLGATFLEKEHYIQLFEKEGFHPVDEVQLQWTRKMTASQAKEELQFACNEAPRIFSHFGVEAIAFDDLWSRFGARIEEHGMAYWSQVTAIILRRQ